MSSKAEREMKKLADFNAPGVSSLGALPARATGEQRGAVKVTSTKPKGVADKLNSQVKEAAQERQKKMDDTRQMYISKSGSKSEGESPASKLAALGYADLRQEVGRQPDGSVVKGESGAPQTLSSGARHLPTENFKSPSKDSRVGAGTPSRVPSEELSSSNLAKASPRNLDAEIAAEEV